MCRCSYVVGCDVMVTKYPEKAAEEESHFSPQFMVPGLTVFGAEMRVVLEEAAHLRVTRKQEGRRGLARDKTHP